MARQLAFERTATPPPWLDDADPDSLWQVQRRTAAAIRARDRRDRRGAIDGLAIGAPLTAAFAGLLLAEGGAAAGTPASGEGLADPVAGVAPAGVGGIAPSTATAGAVPPWPSGTQALLQAAPGTGAADGPGDAGAQDAGFAGLAAPGATGGSGLAIPESGAAAATGAPATSGAGAQVSLTLLGGGAGTEPGGEVTAPDGDSDGPGPVGVFVPGTDGDDVIIGTDRDDHLFGGDGNDEIHGLAGDDYIEGNAGNDLLFGGPGHDTLLGGTGNDEIHGGPGRDTLLGEEGDDELFGGGGRDRLDGGPGDDLLDGGPGPDRMVGGTGDDILVVSDLHDVALGGGYGPGGGGTDTLVVQDGFAEQLLGTFGVGQATFVLAGSFGSELPSEAPAYRQQLAPDVENVTLTGTANHAIVGDGGANQLIGNAGDNKLYGGGGDDALFGGGGNDLLEGGGGDDRLNGNAGDDILRGGPGDDLLRGGDGDDILQGGTGADLLYGEAGNDTFVLGLNDSAVDTIFDHEGVNQIRLPGAENHLVEAALVGDDLHVLVDKSTIGVVSGYRGHEDAWSGIDAGQGLRPIDSYLVGQGGPATGAAAMQSTAGAPAPDDLLGPWLDAPSISGGGGADLLAGTSGADWLSGLAGDDHLIGGDGPDVLAGGAGSDLLEGGGGDDRYLFRSDEGGLDTIRDAEGSNVAELIGFTGAKVEGVVIGRDLLVVADHAPVFRVEDFVGNEKAFAGIHVDDHFVPTEDLLA